MQLDTLLRFYAAFLVENPHDFASAVMSGQQVKNLVDRAGLKLTDRHLVDSLSIEYPWMKNVYTETSGYIHFSTKHIFSALHGLNEDDRSFQIQLSSDDIERAEEWYGEAIDAFYHITEIFLLYLEGWVVTKANPELVHTQKIPA